MASQPVLDRDGFILLLLFEYGLQIREQQVLKLKLELLDAVHLFSSYNEKGTFL